MAKIVHLRNIKRALQLESSLNSGESLVKYVIGGRVSNYRTYKSFNFIDLVDGSTPEHLQVVVKKNVLRKPELGSFLICQGDITSSSGSQQAIEFKVDQLNYLGKCDPSKYPLAETNKVRKIPDAWFRQNLHLRPRADHFASLLRVRSELETSLHMILKQMDFFKVHTPILTGNDSEASSDLFMVQRSKYLEDKRRQQPASDNVSSDDESESSSDELEGYAINEHSSQNPTLGNRNVDPMRRGRHVRDDYFRDRDVFMVTSAQLHLESLAASLSRVYCLAPAFRAESTISQRHLCEFTMLEAEESNVTSLEALMDRVESIVKFCAQYLGEVSEFKDDFANLLNKYSNGTNYERLAESKYIRMTYDEAIEILQRTRSQSSPVENGSVKIACHYGCDLNRKHERVLLEHCNNVPIFLTNYPKNLKPFYMKSCDYSPDKVHNFDLIAPFGGEICGGSLREDNLEMLEENLRLDGRNCCPTFGAEKITEIEQSEFGFLNEDSKDGREATNRKELGILERRRATQLRHKFGWYLELREFGSFPHGGFGIGLERFIQSMLGIKNIKDTIAFPRWPGNCAI